MDRAEFSRIYRTHGPDVATAVADGLSLSEALDQKALALQAELESARKQVRQLLRDNPGLTGGEYSQQILAESAPVDAPRGRSLTGLASRIRITGDLPNEN